MPEVLSGKEGWCRRQDLNLQIQGFNLTFYQLDYPGICCCLIQSYLLGHTFEKAVTAKSRKSGNGAYGWNRTTIRPGMNRVLHQLSYVGILTKLTRHGLNTTPLVL